MSVAKPRIIEVINVEYPVQEDMEKAGFFFTDYMAGLLCSSHQCLVPDGWIVKSIDNDDKYELYDPQNVLRFTLLKC